MNSINTSLKHEVGRVSFPIFYLNHDLDLTLFQRFLICEADLHRRVKGQLWERYKAKTQCEAKRKEVKVCYCSLSHSFDLFIDTSAVAATAVALTMKVLQNLYQPTAAICIKSGTYL